LPEPYSKTKLLPYDSFGWFQGGNLAGLTRLITHYNVKTVIEVGSYKGSSCRYMASLLPQDGLIYAVDSFVGDLFDQCNSNTIRAGLTHKIVTL
jgi:predicted O-methyltransferase YrrM